LLYQIKSNLRYKAVASRWHHVGDLIDSGFKLHTSRPEAYVLQFVPSG